MRHKEHCSHLSVMSLTSAWIGRFGMRCSLSDWLTVTWSRTASSMAMGSEQGKGGGDLFVQRVNETAPFHTPDKLNPVKGPSSDGWHMNWWVEIWLHKCYGSLGKEKRDWQKHLQNEKLSKIWLHTFNKQVGRAILNLKHLGYYALCQTSCQGLALSSLQDLLQRTVNYN